VLGKARASSLHSSSHDGLGGGLGDASANRIVSLNRFRILHASNGVEVASQPLTFTPGTPDTFTLFAQDGAGDNPTLSTSLYEVILYNRTLSAAELTLVHRYLGSRYGIAVP
jgi:hypothetical protein